MEFNAQIWLWLIPLLVVLVSLLFVANSKSRKSLVRRFASERLVAELLQSYSPTRRKLKNVLIIMGLALLLVALARPIVGYEWQESKSKGIDILFALDSSKSMLARDIKPNRLDRAKFAILDFIDQLEGDRVGLVAFAGEAFLQCPLTLDYNAFRQSLEAVDTNVISTGGTDIARAIDESGSAFQETNNHKIIVLITDGEDLEASGIERARRAANEGVTIYTVGVGTAEGAVIPVSNRFGQIEYLKDDQGNLVQTKLDEATLSTIAEVTGGFYVPLGATGYGLEQVYEAGLQSIPEQELSAQMQRTGIERFQWPLALALLLLAWEPLIGTRKRLFRRRAATTALFMIGTLPFMGDGQALRAQERPMAPAATPAATEVDTEAPELVDPAIKKRRSAVESRPQDARMHYNLGNTYYQNERFADAVRAYTNALSTTDLSLQSDAFYNLGNSRFRQGAATLEDVGSPEAMNQADEQAFAQAMSALQQGNAILEKATANKIPEALRNEEARQQTVPQEQIQQAIQVAEQSKGASEETQKSDESAVQTYNQTGERWQQSLDNYASAAELNPESPDAAHNATIVLKRFDELQENRNLREQAIKRHQSNIESLEKLIEELKKLLEQQDNQDQQNDQNQDQQDQNQQNDQNQDSQSQQDQQNQDGGGGQENGQSQSDPNEGQDSESGEQEQNEGDGQQEPQDADQEQGAEDKQDGRNEEPGDREDGSSPQEQAGEQREQEGQQGQTDQQEPIELSEEDAQAAAEAAAGGDDKSEPAAGAEQGEVVQPGIMSREQARRFLESMKDDEKKLPVSGYGPRKYRIDEEGKRKDW